ncbi:MAG TPA: hypothetical protein RMH99_26695 [Sandaracinaceae bacterium LLY-WYZ-13_1]|nr:hypothetical protein [Sandaracinaceae bacterium LLY-WYZ-13_1]
MLDARQNAALEERAAEIEEDAWRAAALLGLERARAEVPEAVRARARLAWVQTNNTGDPLEGIVVCTA